MTIDYLKQWLKIKYITINSFIKCRYRRYKKLMDCERNYAFIFFAADYNNLGDIAITIAQHHFLESCLPNYEIIDVAVKDTYGAINAIKKLDPRNVIITLIGGGNNGTLYEFIEGPRRCVLSELKKYKIISFPQTAFYEVTDRGRPYLEAFQRVCSNCSDLTLVAREQYTFDFYKENVKANLLMTPDIVFSLEGIIQTKNKRSDYIAMIMRNDKEKLISKNLEDSICRMIRKERLNVRKMDTCAIDIREGADKIFYNYLDELSKAKYAVTDRLHGMILCYITNTPCYAININNPKLKSTYNTWIGEDCLVKFVENFENIENELHFVFEHQNKRRQIVREMHISSFKKLESLVKNNI